LIFLGGYLLTRYFKRSRDEGTGEQLQPYSLVPGRFSESSSETGRFSNRAGRR
jgi:hypothetical protein